MGFWDRAQGGSGSAESSIQRRLVRAHGPESCTSERSLLQLVPLIWPKIYGATPLPPSKTGLGHPKLKKSLGHFWHNFFDMWWCDFHDKPRIAPPRLPLPPAVRELFVWPCLCPAQLPLFSFLHRLGWSLGLNSTWADWMALRFMYFYAVWV